MWRKLLKNQNGMVRAEFSHFAPEAIPNWPPLPLAQNFLSENK